MIRDLIKNKPAKERADIKGKEIAKIKTIAKTRQGSYFIEIVDMKPIDGGIEVFVKAWTGSSPKVIYKDIGDEIGRFVRKDVVRTIPANTQIGFGKDGTVDIERFVIINPPVLIDDPNGNIVRESVIDGQIRQRKLRESPKDTLLEYLAKIISVKTQVHGSENIIQGKIGNTTTTVLPDDDPESTSVDGWVYYDTQAGGSWAEAHDAASGTAVNDTADNSIIANSQEVSGASNRYQIVRGFFLFDTSGMPDTDTIDSATLSVKVTEVDNQDTTGPDYINIYTTTPASNTALVTGDFDQIGTTAQATAIDLGDISVATTTWTLNATGLGNIDKTGITKFGMREGHDVEDTPIADNARNRIGVNTADLAGTANDPTLTIEHSAAAVAGGGGHQLLTLGVG
jgi:hypothetical protein